MDMQDLQNQKESKELDSERRLKNELQPKIIPKKHTSTGPTVLEKNTLKLKT